MIKTIEISKKHHEKLFEMAHFFFPEHRAITGCNENIEITHDDKVRIYYSPEKGILHMIDIPWFEFCFTWLAERVFNPNPALPNRTLKGNITNFFWSCNVWWSEVYLPGQNADERNIDHPIDYLYQCYLKIR